MAGPSRFQRFLLPGFAFKAVVIGGGYSTGREIAEFFVPLGPWGGVAAMAFAMLIWSLVCVVTFLLARRIGAFDYRPFFRALLGRAWPVFEASYVFFFILILAVYGAAAGALGEAMFGWPTIAGVLLLMALITAFTAFGNASVEWLFKYASFFLYGVYALFVIFGFQRFGGEIAASFDATPGGTGGTGGWAAAGLTYASYNAVAAAVVLPTLRHLTSDRDAVVSGALAGPLAIVPALLFFCCMMAFYPAIGAEVLPADFLLGRMGLPLLHGAFQVMIFAALLQSSVSSVHAVNERIAGALADRGRVFVPAQRLACTIAILVIAIFAAAQFGLVALIAKGYRALALLLIASFLLPLFTVGLYRLKGTRPFEGAS
jgi:uncharacterized membrane protein YkvI